MARTTSTDASGRLVSEGVPATTRAGPGDEFGGIGRFGAGDPGDVWSDRVSPVDDRQAGPTFEQLRDADAGRSAEEDDIPPRQRAERVERPRNPALDVHGTKEALGDARRGRREGEIGHSIEYTATARRPDLVAAAGAGCAGEHPLEENHRADDGRSPPSRPCGVGGASGGSS